MVKANPAPSGMVTLEGVARRYGTRRAPVWALREVSLAVPSGQFVAVMGATGSGKSTLLHCAAGLDRPDAGRVWLAGAEIGRMGERRLTKLRRDRVGFVFQAYNLLSELSVAQNVVLPSRLGGPRVRREDLARVLDAVGLAGLERRPVGELSGGQRQRVAVARALVTRPAVVYADEPTGALDPTTGAQILGLLRDAVDRDGVTVMMVTHDPGAAAVSDRLVLLRGGQIVADGATPDAEQIAWRLREVSVDAAPTGSTSASSMPAGQASAGRMSAGRGQASVRRMSADPALAELAATSLASAGSMAAGQAPAGQRSAGRGRASAGSMGARRASAGPMSAGLASPPAKPNGSPA